MIPAQTVQQILDTARVEDVIGEYVDLKKRGVNLIGLCPFHNEKTPSFTVSPTKNIYKCFGCGQAGGPVNFLMEHEQMRYPEALRHLAQKYNIEIEEEQVSEEYREEQRLRDGLFLINDFALSFYQKQLLETDYGRSVGLSYFKERGFRDETIKKFGLGYAPSSGAAFVQAAQQKGFAQDMLRKVGLMTSYGKDFFRGRVQFTLHNAAGKIVGFAGRILEKNKKQPKYINTPESDIYNKRKFLYGLFQARKAIRQEDECFMVEGYTDVISLHQSGIENVVASSGTSLTADQVHLVKRYSQQLTILYDGDAAGVKAALRGLDLVLAEDMNVKVVLLPEGEDPDSYVQRIGTTAFKEYLKTQAKDFILFKTEVLLAETQNDPVKRAQVIRDVVASIAKIPDQIKRSLYIKNCAERLDVTEQILVSEMNVLLRKNIAQHTRKQNQNQATAGSAQTPSSQGEQAPFPDEEFPQGGAPLPELQTQSPQLRRPSYTQSQERDIVRILIQFGAQPFDEEGRTVAAFLLGEILELFDEWETLFKDKMCLRLMRDIVEAMTEDRLLDSGYFLHHEAEDVQRFCIDLLAHNYSYSPGWERLGIYLHSQKPPDENQVADALSTVNFFLFRQVQKLAKENQEQLKNLNPDSDYMLLLKTQQQLKRLERTITERLRLDGAISIDA